MNQTNKGGFFKLIIIIIIGVALLYYFKVDVRGWVDYLIELYGKFKGN